ncbi:hypothetical protein J2X76_002232 [Neorhizobium sp. 2083]|uniref:hypothetical protein n=1 Tax=Neorhizobium sp. 2083 TaxID=2817762 RepID=UPI000DE0B7B9|nr:hypothetical protein [Neorhizobium sp. 2083]MDR6817059.1 hypothetical protein [Neorhizobium sp. 2083]
MTDAQDQVKSQCISTVNNKEGNMSKIKVQADERAHQYDLAISLLRTETEAVARSRFRTWTGGSPTAGEEFEAARLDYESEKANE